MKTTLHNHIKTLKGKAKIQYIWDYYKFPLAVSGIALYIFIYVLYHHFSYKETVLYAALVNVNAGGKLTQGLSGSFLDYLNLNPSENKLQLYTGLYLTDDEQSADHRYAYASRIKILACIDEERLDVVLMNKEAFDAFAQNGYLCDLENVLPQADPALYNTVKSNLTANIIILEDNSIDRQLDSSIPYHAITEEHYYGIDLSCAELIQNAGFDEPIYFGIITNSPRKDSAAAYLTYLFTEYN